MASLRPIVLRLLFAASALLLGWLAVTINLQRGCAIQDTPYLPVCPADPQDRAARASVLRERIAAGPGDTRQYVALALAEPRPAQQASALAAAARLAPNHPDVLLLQATAAVQRQDWDSAVALLVKLADQREHPQASQALARLVAAGQGALLMPHLQPGSRWLAPVMRHLSQLSAGALATATPLLAEALKRGILATDALPAYIRELKAAGAWADAASLWLAQHPGGAPVLYNGGFDHAFLRDGFDWEVAEELRRPKTGAVVEQALVANRGSVLELRLTGRALPTPLLRQYLFIGEGRYRLTGEYLSRQLRLEHGMAWALRCTSRLAEATRSTPLADSGAAWQAFTFEFTVPAGCGQAVSLQLETGAAYEAVAGGAGRIAFDALKLDKVTE